MNKRFLKLPVDSFLLNSHSLISPRRIDWIPNASNFKLTTLHKAHTPFLIISVYIYMNGQKDGQIEEVIV